MSDILDRIRRSPGWNLRALDSSSMVLVLAGAGQMIQTKNPSTTITRMLAGIAATTSKLGGGQALGTAISRKVEMAMRSVHWAYINIPTICL